MPSKFSNSTVERDTKSMRFGISWRERERGRFGAHANGGLPCAGTRTESCNCEALRSQDMTSRALCWNPGGGVTGIEMRSDE